MPILLNKTDPSAPHARFAKPSPLLIGAAADADLQLQVTGVSAHHCWIERHADGFHLVDLNTTNGSYVNGQRVSDVLLQPGDLLRLGKAELEFQLTDEEKAELEEARAKQTEPSQLVKVDSLPAAGAAGSELDVSRRCPQCGAPIWGAANFCPRCGLPVSAVARPLDQFVQPVEGPGIRGPGILPLLALICGLVGPLLLGVGWLLGIILGLMSLAIIRRTGGFERDRRQAMWGIAGGITWAILGFLAAGAWYWQHSAEERRARLEQQIAGNEEATLAELANLARAQKYAKAIVFSDTNGNLVGEYLPFDQLARLESPFVNRSLAEKGEAHGYRFTVREASEDRFLILARPLRTGRTGSRLFSVDASGVLRGDKISAAQPAHAGLLPPLQRPNAFEHADDEIAEDALAVARQVAKRGDYEKCRAILDGIRKNFTITHAARQLTDLERTIDPFLLEARADQKYREAGAAHQRGDRLLAIALLRDIEANYPTFSRIQDATRQRQELEVQHAQAQEDQARELFRRAEELEREGRVAEAETVYFQIEKQYPDTEWARQVITIKPALQRQLREQQVEGWLQQLASLSPQNDYEQILRLCDQLRRNYSDTDAYRAATDTSSELQSLVLLEQKALAQKLKIEALKQIQAGRTRRALTALEKALAETPDLAVHLQETLWELYPRVAEQLRDEHDVSGALALYEKFLRLNPPESALNRPLFAELSFKVGQADLLANRPEAALPRFQQAEALYRRDPEFNALYGRVLCRLGRYEDAIARYDAAAAAPRSADLLGAPLYFWRAWTWLHWAQQVETDVRAEAQLPSLAELVRHVEQARTERRDESGGRPGPTNGTPPATNIVISLQTVPPAPTDTAATGATNLIETLLTGALELVADVEAARVDFSRQELTSRGKGDKAEVSIRFEKAQRTQQFRDRASKLRQSLLGERERQQHVAEQLQRLFETYSRAQTDLEQAARLSAPRDPLLAENARLLLSQLTERADLYRSVVPPLIRVRREDLRIAETTLDLAEQAIGQLQWNLKGGISISKTVEESYRRLQSRKALDEAVAAFHRFDQKRLDLQELWRRYSLPEP